MDIATLLNDKTVKPKEKTETLSKWLLDSKLTADDLTAFAETAKDPAKAPRVKWESAKVIGNTAHLFTDKLNEAIKNLLDNSEHEGTVVRWSAAFALGQILKLKTKHNKGLLPAIETICNREEKNSIKKIYLDAIKKTTK